MAYVANFGEMDEEDLTGSASGGDSSPELVTSQNDPVPPSRGYVPKSHTSDPGSGDEGIQDKPTSEKSKKVLTILSDDSDEDFNLASPREDKSAAGDTPVKARERKVSVSDLDFDSDIDIDEELERTLQSKYDRSTEQEDDHLKAVEVDIFGASDDEDLDLSLDTRKRRGEGGDEGSNETDSPDKKKQRYSTEMKDFDGDDDLDDSRNEGITEFDLILAQKKKKNKRRKKPGVDSISTNDDVIMDVLKSMQQAAQEDREMNEKQQTALNKLKLLPSLQKHLQRQDSLSAFVDCGLLSVIAEWLCPLPDKSLPHVQIRTELLKILESLSASHITTHLLKMSGIGKAVMLLYKHPKEARKNRDRAAKLIHLWARPIFGVESNLKSISRDEREERDHKHAQNVRRRHSSGARESLNSSSEDPLRPGEKGFVGRARVPQPSTRDYVTRPKWNIQTDITHMKSKTPSKIDHMVRDMKSKKNKTKGLSHAVQLSIEGAKMPL